MIPGPHRRKGPAIVGIDPAPDAEVVIVEQAAEDEPYTVLGGAVPISYDEVVKFVADVWDDGPRYGAGHAPG